MSTRERLSRALFCGTGISGNHVNSVFNTHETDGPIDTDTGVASTLPRPVRREGQATPAAASTPRAPGSGPRSAIILSPQDQGSSRGGPPPPGSQRGTNGTRAGPLAGTEMEDVLREEPVSVEGTNRGNWSHDTCHKIKSHASILTKINSCAKE